MNFFDRRFVFISVAALLLVGSIGQFRSSEAGELFPQEQLVAWCIVPFDASKRGPVARTAMLKELGIGKCAYDWRNEHVPTFEEEFLEYQRQGIELFAFWRGHPEAYRLFKKHDLHPQIWMTVPSPAGKDDAARVSAAVKQLLPEIKKAEELGCKFGLYNHGGWGGEPQNMIAICEELRSRGHENVGIVYNFHHAHNHIGDWPETFELLKPYLLCLNINGMNPKANPKIVPLGDGQYETEMLQVVAESAYRGPIGILDHRNTVDSREALEQNLKGLEKIRQQLGTQAKFPADELCLPPMAKPGEELDFNPQLISRLEDDAKKKGDPVRGARVFASAKTACVSCHQVNEVGGKVGPELTKLASERTAQQIIESVLWPKREVKPEYIVRQVVTIEGKILSGYQYSRDEEALTLKDPASGKLTAIPIDDIDDEIEGTTPMPAALVAAMTYQQQVDLFRFLGELKGDAQPLSDAVTAVLNQSTSHGPTSFPYESKPLIAANWPNASYSVNRERIYDFYTKQAEYFRQQEQTPILLSAFPSLDGPNTGHWGNQTEEDWRDGRWSDTDLGTLQAGITKLPNRTVARGICVRLGETGEYAVCFDPDKLTYEAFWQGGFLSLSSKRNGFLDGLRADGKLIPTKFDTSPKQPHEYLGFYRAGDKVVFAYRIAGVDYLDAPAVKDGQFVHEVAPVNEHSMRHVLNGGSSQWPEVIETNILPGKEQPFAIDRIELPEMNLWNSLMYFGGHDFLSDGSALICTMQGDVWHVSGLDSGVNDIGTAKWKRFAGGLNHALGLVVDEEDNVFVQCRDQLMKLVDLNGDDEVDFYQCWNNTFRTSSAGHDFICGLDRDAEGNFYTASGNEGVLRISADGKTSTVIATGFRNPDGLMVTSHGTVTVPCSEGAWTPGSMICEMPLHLENSSAKPPHFGYRGPRGKQPPSLPLAYVPRGIDNSSGGQVEVESDAWGPLNGRMLHLSFGMGSAFVLLRDVVNGQEQGAIVPFAGDFDSGVHRGSFRKQDGQLYVSGMNGWGTYTAKDGCFTRVRYTGEPYQVPTGFHVHENGIVVTFAESVDAKIAGDIKQQFAQCWNYRYSGAYGSPEFSTTHPGVVGHDPLAITSAHVLSDGKSVFLEIPDIQPVNQLHLRMHVNSPDEFPNCNPAGDGHDLFVTVHDLDEPFADYPGYEPQNKTIAVHPILVDMRLNAKRKPNPWRKEVKKSQPIMIETGKNLTFATTELVVKAGQPLKFTLQNPDVVPHNWVLVKPGTLRDVGQLANQLIASPDAFAEHYIPKSDDVLNYTDVVSPGQSQTIYFTAPETPGRYPYLCTFPGHWMVMNGVMIVE
ncbi:DUF6797 domain-containing protein [Calycomorphotria hydatis]|uniref:Auracyanin-A n=1 Tax=Calycomorphotria hydatis TaxID=2528027 RepID=A0A517T439_9PLAN|nr:DUF6797 domain-containing protein [Calycomorphotria hydatis]QDT63135.1 Auracyanin-A precursor [Calycomorphotria hydatis]